MRTAFAIARRELRGGLSGFRIFLVSLALGVAAIAGVGSLSAALVTGLEADGRKLLGGDVELRLTHRPASAAQKAYITERARLSTVIDLRAMAHGEEGRRSLVELRGVDALHPHYGVIETSAGPDVPALVARRDGEWGALAEATLLRRTGLAVGDLIRVGEVAYRLRGTVSREPDRGTDGIVLGPRLLVAGESLAETGLVVEGALVRYRYRIALPASQGPEAFVRDINAAFPDAGWRVRDLRNGAPGLRRFIERMRIFLTLVGLTALLVGGLGVANAVGGYLDTKTGTIATLKCLGGSGRLIVGIYLLQVMALGLVGIAVGLALGALAPYLAGWLLADKLPFTARVGLYPGPLAMAALFGLITAFAFSLIPLGRARDVPAAALFRAGADPAGRRPKALYLAAAAASLALLAALAILLSDNSRFASWFVAGAGAALLTFLLAGSAITDIARRLPRLKSRIWRFAIANLHRPGAATLSIVVSFGLGLTVLAAIALIEGNLTRQVAERLPERAPAFFFIDIQPHQVERFDEIVAALPQVGAVEKAASLRGRIVKVNGVAAADYKIDPESAWVLRGDRGITYAARPPEGTEITAGEWWPEDYAGKPLVSFDEEAAKAMKVGVGDSLTLNILGREITTEIANLRDIEWGTIGINFVLILDPATLRGAPHTFMATVEAPRAAEEDLERAVTDAFANVTAIRVRDALETANALLDNIGMAVRTIAALALIAGIVVLAGAIAASHHRRVYESVVLKVIGATRGEILRMHLAEFILLGLITALLASGAGTTAAWVVVTEIMHAPWLWLPETLAVTLAISLVITVAAGLLGAWAALSRKPAPLLRNE